ncbi:hypothetical protein CVIRNUC_010951 [Coccomyxa viridis]|uniref:LAGLIDADG homing endonuclease n=1 Tax=Coccomyxa viridis TaxID=1274662 RepID=A0AAV1IP36_9CHLO|nr:hypothetical protein CVIRNUC_010951 [Coccomyxa viridis]
MLIAMASFTGPERLSITKASVMHRLICRYNCKLVSGQDNSSRLCMLVLHHEISLMSSAGNGTKGRLLCTRVQGRNRDSRTQSLLTGIWSASGVRTRQSQWTINVDLGDAKWVTSKRYLHAHMGLPKC